MGLSFDSANRFNAADDRMTIRKPAEILFVVPPVRELSFQSLGVPALAAYMRSAGFRIAGKLELNIGFQHYITGCYSLDQRLVAAEWDRLQQSACYKECYEHRRDSYYIRIELPFGYSYIVNCNDESIESLLGDERVNMHIRYYRDCRIAQQVAAATQGVTRVVGISIEGENQVVAALTLAREAKRLNPEILTVAGGPWVTGMRQLLRTEGLLLRGIDFLIPHKGEIALEALMRAIEAAGGRPGVPVPGVMARQGEGVFGEAPECDPYLPAAMLPRPEVFPLEWYARPNVLPYETERGCYWAKCKFCHHVQHFTHAYNSKPIGKVIEDLKAYAQEFSYEVVAFVDAAMPPRRVRQIAEALLASKLDKRWAGFSKIERQFTRDLFHLAARSGLDVLSFGVETATARLSALIGKPLDPEVAYSVLHDCAAAGIYTAIGVMTGLPSETAEDLDALWKFLDRLRSFACIQPKLYEFERGSEYYENAAQYGLEIVPRPPGMRLSPYAHFIDHGGGTTRERLRTQRLNQRWVRENMSRTLDWKAPGDRFCQWDKISGELRGPEKPAVDLARCDRCDACNAVCPSGAIWVDEYQWRLNDPACDGCAHCATACPLDALRMV